MKRGFAIALLSLSISAWSASVDLQQSYPTQLTEGDTDGSRARAWEFAERDVFSLSRFELNVGSQLKLKTADADLGIGRSQDGAVWAVIMPRGGGSLTSGSGNEKITHVWLRFHPQLIGELFPSKTVGTDGNAKLLSEMRRVANVKFAASWHSGPRALIPPSESLTVDVDTASGVRRFFIVDRNQGTVRYIDAFERRPVPPLPKFDPAQAAEAFDTLWSAFDREYAMFGLRAGLDWNDSKERFRPQALKATSTAEFADVCNRMLLELQDLHVHVSVNGEMLRGYSRLRVLNANPRAWKGLLPSLERTGREVLWAKTQDGIGYLCITGWSNHETPKLVDLVLEKLRDTRGLVFDVRLNGGGGELLARDVAGRFHAKDYVYAHSQFRNGPAHDDLGPRRSRTLKPRGPWRYEKPVVLLIGQKCMSSNEAFVLMMTGAPNVTSYGDRTAGSSGNPRRIELPFSITVNLPRWIALRPDGKPFDGTGIAPDGRFEAEENSFTGPRDDLLTAALNRLRQP
ncbi:MAG: S41 family peptidase [Limisphaerales bacterium]